MHFFSVLLFLRQNSRKIYQHYNFEKQINKKAEIRTAQFYCSLPAKVFTGIIRQFDKFASQRYLSDWHSIKISKISTTLSNVALDERKDTTKICNKPRKNCRYPRVK